MTDAPLDLRAVERDLHQTWDAEDAPRLLYAHATTLLGLLRETRAALQAMLTTRHDVDMDGTHRGFYEPDAPACAGCAAKDHAAAVLGAAQDGPA